MTPGDRDYLDPERRKIAIRILFITIFLDLLGFGIILPQLPYYATACGANGTVVGLVGASYSLLQFLMSPFWGRLSDRIGRRPIILIGLVGAAASYVIFGAAFRIGHLLGISPIPILFISRALAGFFNANLATAQAFMADISPGQDRAAAMGLVGAAIGLGFILGPGFSALIYHLSRSAELPFYVAAAVGIFTFCWAYRELPESRSDSPAPERRGFSLFQVPWGPLVLVLGAYFLSTFAISGMENTLGLFLEASPELHYNSTQFAMVVLWLGVVGVITQGYLIKRLSRTMKEQQLLTIGSAIMIIGLGFLPWVTTSFSLYWLMTCLLLGYGLVSPSLSSLNALLAPENIRGEMLGVGQSMASLGRILGPIAGGKLYDTCGHGSPYILGAALSLCCAFLGACLIVQMRSRPNVENQV